ncbi:hypothetical protein DC347_05685 [Pseudarthrobacter sp. AG30]|nr:hypothetical protein DC347_05685 [Pseudarthrobacter sp. AG30]
MVQVVQGYFRSAVRFPKRSTELLRGMKAGSHVIGVCWLALSLLWDGAWQTILWAVVGLAGLVQSALVEKEILRRTNGAGKGGCPMDAEYNVMADFHQFTVSDPTADFGDLWAKWTDETIDAMFVQGDRYIAIGTMRNMYAPVLIRLDSERSFTGRVDKVATGVLEVPSGVVEVSGSTDNGMSGGKVKVPPGTYRVEVQYFNLDSISDDGLEGDDRYMITLFRTGR